MAGGKHLLLAIDPETGTGTCAACGPAVPFDRAPSHSKGWRCRAAHLATKGTKLNRSQRGRELLGDDFDRVLAEQEGRCAICGGPMDPPCADHCHERDRFRALLCAPCNRGLGHFGDDPERLRAAADYLDRHCDP